jgi:Protein of unknown function (DUF2842)
MTLRSRKALGTLATVVWLVLYSLIAMAMGGAWVVGRGVFAELTFYVVAGVAWIPVEMLIIRWMSRPDPA